MARSEALKRAQKKYKDKVYRKTIDFNENTESDLIEYVKSLDNFSGTVKAYLKEDMKKETKDNQGDSI